MRRSLLGAVLVGLAIAFLAWWWVDREEGERGEATAPVVAMPDRDGGAEKRELTSVAPPAADANPEEAPREERRNLAPEETPRLELLVVDPDGAALPAAAWAVFRGAEVLASGQTDERGLAQLVADGAPAELCIAHESHAPHRETVELTPGTLEVGLLGGAIVSGWVTVDGAPPPEPIKLKLRAREPYRGADFVPEPVWRALERDARPVRALRASSGDGGAFRFTGLAIDWAGTLSWSSEFVLRQEDEDPVWADDISVHLQAPVERLAIDLVLAAWISGRVVRPETGEPVAKARVEASWTHAGTTLETSRRADEDGRFLLRMGAELPPKVSLRLADASGAGSRDVTLEFAPGTKGHDAGDLATLAVHPLRFVVRDSGGKPIENARATPVPDAQALSRRTDAEGNGEVGVSDGTRALRVVATGFRPTEVAITPAAFARQPLEIVLTSDTLLEVRVAGPGGLFVRLEGREPPFRGKDGPRWSPEAGGYKSISTSGEASSVTFRPDDDGVSLLGALRPGLSFTVLVVDGFENVRAQREVPPLAEGERRVLRIEVPETVLRPLTGRVVNTGGSGVANASVQILRAGSLAARRSRTDASGYFKLENVAADRVFLLARADGYAPLVRPDEPVTDEPVELRLDGGFSVRVTVAGPEGEAPPSGSVWAGLPEVTQRFAGGPLDEGAVVLERLPLTEVAIRANVGGRVFERRHDPRVPDVEIAVPAWRSLVLAVEDVPHLEPGELLYLQCRSLHLDPPVSFRRELKGGEVSLPVVFHGRYDVHLGRQVGVGREQIGESTTLDVAADSPERVSLRF